LQGARGEWRGNGTLGGLAPGRRERRGLALRELELRELELRELELRELELRELELRECELRGG